MTDRFRTQRSSPANFTLPDQADQVDRVPRVNLIADFESHLHIWWLFG